MKIDLAHILTYMVENNPPKYHFRTNLDRKIKTPQDAKRFLCELYANEELFNPDDDAGEIIFDNSEPSPVQSAKLNELMAQVTFIDNFDPYEFCNQLIKDD